jgi:Immunoglobulin domain
MQIVPRRVDFRLRVPARRNLAQGIAFVVTLAFLITSGCAGGWQGSKAAASSGASISSPASQTVTVGQTATFAVSASGTGPFTYQWYKNGVAISGATSSTYMTPATVIGDSGSIFTVVVTGPGGPLTSSPAALTVNPVKLPIAGSIVPSSTTPPYKGSVNLVPTFSGGTAVIGSTGVGSSDITASAVSGGSYPTPALTAGKTYTLTVTNAQSDVVSTTCIVTPQTVAITPISPANQTFAPGAAAFTAIASGGLTNNLTWTASSGSFTGNVWTAPAVAGTYTITATSVDNPAVFVTTHATVAAPSIATQPTNQRVCTGGVLTLSVIANNATGYQWNLNGTPIPGATSTTYSVSNAASANAGNYTVTVSSAVGNVTSNVASVIVGSSITSNPTSLSVVATQTAVFSVGASGLSPFGYQWYRVPPAGTTGIAIAGATSSSYTTPPTAASDDGAKYYATVTDSCSTLTSTSATLNVTTSNVGPTIVTQPTGQSVPQGGATSFSVIASGTPALSYQWYVIPAGTTTASPVVGATSATYAVPATSTLAANDQDKYYAIVTNTWGQAVSQPATLAVGPGIQLQITGQPTNQYVNVGDPATFTVTATSSLPLTYQWYRADPGSATFTAIPGATNSTYTLDSSATTDNDAVYKVVVSNGTSSVTSNSAALFVGPLAGVDNFCSSNWNHNGNAIVEPGCAFQLTAATNNQRGEIIWPTLISTANVQLSFHVDISNPSTPPADGFAVVFGDPSLGATPTSLGLPGQGLGAEGIPGFVLGFDTYHNAGEYPVPYVAIGRGENSLWEKPWLGINTSIPALATVGSTVSHDYTMTLIDGTITVNLDGVQILSSDVGANIPPISYFYVTSSTGGSYEQLVISNLSATVSAPSE